MKMHDMPVSVTAIAWLVASSVALSAAEPVAPPYGFVSVSLPAHSDATVSCPFAPVVSSVAVVLEDQLTAATNVAAADRVLVWDGTRYRTAAKLILPGAPDPAGVGAWYEIATSQSGEEAIVGLAGDAFRLTPGTGFVLCNRQAFAQTVRIGGQVVVDAVRTVTVPAGAGLIGLPYTTAKPAGETRLSESCNILATNAFDMGKAYWIKSDQNGQWQEPRPYGNPFSLSNAPVRIADLILDPDKVTLDIRVTDASVQAFDVLVLDLSASSVVTDWTRGWRLAASNIAASGQTELHWCDDLTASGSSFKGVRLYLALRADAAADLDGDGNPDLLQNMSRANEVLEQGVPAQVTAPGTSVAGASIPDETGNNSNPQDPPGLIRENGIVFVDIRQGDDRFSGLNTVVSANDGPKKTIAAGTQAVKRGGSVVIHDGVYEEDLDVSGKSVNIRIRGNVTLKNKTKK